MLVYWMVSYQSLKTSPILVWPRGPQPGDFWRKQVDCFKSEGAKAWAQIPVTGWSVEYWLMHFVTNAKRKLSPIIVTIAIWVCLKIGYIPNYSHLIGIMISKTIGFRGTNHFQTHPYVSNVHPFCLRHQKVRHWAPGARQGIGGSGRTVVVLLAVVEVLAGDGDDSLTRNPLAIWVTPRVFSSFMTHFHGSFPGDTWSKHMIVPCIFGKLVGSEWRFELRPFLSVNHSMYFLLVKSPVVAGEATQIWDLVSHMSMNRHPIPIAVAVLSSFTMGYSDLL